MVMTMTDTKWKTIRVPKDVYQDAKARKEGHGVTWGEYVNPHAWHSVFQEPQEAPEDTELVNDDAPDIEEIAEQLEIKLDCPERQDTDRILNRLDDLESRLPSKTAQEVLDRR